MTGYFNEKKFSLTPRGKKIYLLGKEWSQRLEKYLSGEKDKPDEIKYFVIECWPGSYVCEPGGVSHYKDKIIGSFITSDIDEVRELMNKTINAHKKKIKQREYNKRNYERHKEKRKEYNRNRYKNFTPEQKAAHMENSQKWVKNNPDKMKVSRHKCYEKNKEYWQQYYLEHRDEILKYKKQMREQNNENK